MKTKLIEKIKQINTTYKLGDFFRNFIAVVLGIIITFAGSDCIAEHNTQKEVKESLQLVKSELLLNREIMQDMGNRITLEQNAARHMFKYKNNLDEIPQDSLSKYLPILFQWSKFTFINDAMEMLKTSSLIQKIENKDLALQIIKTYGTIKVIESSFEMYMHYRSKVQDEFNANIQVKACTFDQTKKRENPNFKWDNNFSEKICLLLFTLPEGLNLLQTIPNIVSPQVYFNSIKEIDKAIEAIEKEYT